MKKEKLDELEMSIVELMIPLKKNIQEDLKSCESYMEFENVYIKYCRKLCLNSKNMSPLRAWLYIIDELDF